MSFINFVSGEVEFKIVYYGCALGGKTTSLGYVHERVDAKDRGKLLLLPTQNDRTLFFDFLPVAGGTVKGFRVRFKLWTVPGQVMYNATRQLVLRGVDGVVFVVDSQWDRMEANLESLRNLEQNLTAMELSLERVPWTLFYNSGALPRESTSYIPTIYQKTGQSVSKLTDFHSIADVSEQQPKPRGEEARRRRRLRRNKDFKNLKLYPVLLQVGKKKKQFWRVTKPKTGGGRSIKTYTNRDEAETAFDLAYMQAKNYGVESFVLNDVQLIDARQAYHILEALGPNYTLVSAASFLADHIRRIEVSVAVKVAVAELLKAKKADGFSKLYLANLANRLTRFVRVFGDRSIASLTVIEIETWLRELGLASLSRNSCHQHLITLWSFAQRRDWVEANVPKQISKAKVTDAEIGILTPEQFAHLLSNASPKTLPFWVIAGFTGLRTAELKRLDWSKVDFDSALIEVTARSSKTATRRHVEIGPALAAWLESYRNRTGLVCPRNLRKLLEADRKRAAIENWPVNACRHSFASYWLAHHKDSGHLAILMGHTKSDLLFRHYRQLVKPAEALKWWGIFPDDRAKVVELAAA